MRWELEGNVRFGDTLEEQTRRGQAIAVAKHLYSGATQFAFLAVNPDLGGITDYDCSTIEDFIRLTGATLRGIWINERDHDGQRRNPPLFYWLERLNWAYWSPLPYLSVPPNQLELFTSEEMKP